MQPSAKKPVKWFIARGRGGGASGRLVATFDPHQCAAITAPNVSGQYLRYKFKQKFQALFRLQLLFYEPAGGCISKRDTDTWASYSVPQLRRTKAISLPPSTVLQVSRPHCRMGLSKKRFDYPVG